MPSPCRSGAADTRAPGRLGQPHRTQIGEQTELLANAQQRGAFGAFLLGNRRVAVGQTDRAEQNGVDFLHSASVASGSALPAASMPAQPTGASVISSLKPNFFSVTRETLMASRMTSGPMPSPANAAILKCFMSLEPRCYGFGAR
jgi:hypothetical protein